MYEKVNKSVLDQFENEHTRIAVWVEYELYSTHFYRPLYFFGPKNLNIRLVVAHADEIYSTFPIRMLTIEKFHLTLESVNAFIKERY
jgi:hypothetical protein